jgi:hypothetical protein
MFIVVPVHDMFFCLSFLNKHEFLKKKLIPYKFNVLFKNDNNFKS